MPSTSLRTPPALLRAYERHARSLPRVAEAVLVVVLAYALAGLVWRLVPAPAGSAWQAPREAPLPSGGAGSQGPNVDLIANAHLFGEVPLAADPAMSELTEAPDTRLDLTLLGILAATADRGSRALIGASNGEEKPYAIGDDVVRGVRLQAIFPDRVILARGGQLETLRLDKDAPSKGGGAPQAVAAAASDVAPSTGALLSSIRQELLNDPSRASEYIRIQPASSGGQLRGYRIYPGRDRTAFNAVGLRPGDLVTQVNGIQLNDANTALQMLGQLSQAGSVSVMVDRGGQQQVVNVNFE
jgi:general secretion pathway protein C